MASADDSSYLQGASDEMVDNVCGPCKKDQIEKGANFYCNECGEYLCTECKNYHRKLSVTKDHTVVTVSELPTADAERRGTDLVIYCGCNNKQEVEFYCKDHDDVFCSPCKNVQHHKCTTCDINKRSAGYSIEMLNLVMSKTESLRNEFEHLHQESSQPTIEASRETCKREIETFRRGLDQFLNKLEHDLLEEMEKRASDQQREIDQKASILAEARNMLESDYTLLENAKQDGRKTTMFMSDLQVSKRLQSYTTRLTDLRKELSISNLSFERNEKLAEIQTEIKEFGYLKGNDSRDSFRDKTILMSGEVKVKLSEDKHVPWISGCSILLTGELVLCDRTNHKIKLHDTGGIRQDNLRLPSMPWDVSVIDANNVIVTLPDKKRLQYIQVLPQLKAGQTIQVGKMCFGVEVSSGEIYTTCHDNPGKGEVQVLGLDGKRKRRLGIMPDGSFMFTVPQYITVSSPGRKIFVSDADGSSITCMTGDGNIIYRYTDNDLKCPLGLYPDAEDNIVVCDAQSNIVKVILSDGRKSKTLLSSINQDVIHLYSITYRKRDNTLIIGCHNADTFLIFELTH